jgi:hypothetical protein
MFENKIFHIMTLIYSVILILSIVLDLLLLIHVSKKNLTTTLLASYRFPLKWYSFY